MPPDDKKPIRAIVDTVRERATQARGEVRRADTNRPVVPVHAFEDEELTDKHELQLITDDELRERRAKRPTDKRLERLESFKDEIAENMSKFGERIGKVEVAVADFGGQMKMMPSLIETMQSAIEAMNQRETVKFTAEVDVHKAKRISDVEVQTHTAKADADVKAIKAKSRSEILTKVVAVLGTIGTAIATAIAAGRC